MFSTNYLQKTNYSFVSFICITAARDAHTVDELHSLQYGEQAVANKFSGRICFSHRAPTKMILKVLLFSAKNW